jgi:hypothetical protein
MAVVRVTPGFLRFFLCLKLAVSVLVLAPSCRAQTVNVSGSYECTQVKVQGKVTGCNAAPLILKTDGHFELRGWEGTYMVDGEWVQLADTSIKARARIEPGHKIVLRFYGKKGWAEMTY